MNEELANSALRDEIDEHGNLYALRWYLSWKKGDRHAVLNGKFSAKDLEAIAWWMQNKGSYLKEKK